MTLWHDAHAALRFLCGEVEEVMAMAGNHTKRGGENEDHAALIIRFRSGALASVSLSDAAPSPWNWESTTGENDTVPKTRGNCYRFVGAKACLDFPTLRMWRHISTDAAATGTPEAASDGGVGHWGDPFEMRSLDCTERKPLGAYTIYTHLYVTLSLK